MSPKRPFVVVDVVSRGAPRTNTNTLIAERVALGVMPQNVIGVEEGEEEDWGASASATQRPVLVREPGRYFILTGKPSCDKGIRL